MRPTSLQEFVGQEHLLGPGKLLSGMVDSVKLGSTTENPSFQGTSPLLGRCQVLVLKTLTPAEIGKVDDRALGEPRRRLAATRLAITAEAREFLIQQSQGDCRVALNALEAAAI